MYVETIKYDQYGLFVHVREEHANDGCYGYVIEDIESGKIINRENGYICIEGARNNGYVMAHSLALNRKLGYIKW